MRYPKPLLRQRRGTSIVYPVPPVSPVGTSLRRVHNELGSHLGVVFPVEWAGVALELIQELRRRCPHIKLHWLRRKDGDLRVGYGGLRGRESEAEEAWKTICASNKAIRDIDLKLGIMRGLES